MSKSIEIAVKVAPVWAEYVSDILIEKIGCSGVVTEEREYKDEIVTKENIGTIKGYISFSEENHVNLTQIQEILWQKREKLIFSGIKEENMGDWSVSLKEIPDEEWAHSWKKYWHVQKITEKIVICPSWEEYNAVENEIIINLDPGSAFGTGTHPTTKLCIQALEKITYDSAKIADIGTGSGILAVAAAKLGAESVIGVDNDASVISVAKENAEKNNVADKCTFFAGSAEDVKGKFEVVIANILPHIIIEMMSELARLTKQDGHLILSGIIQAKSQEVQDSALQNGFKIIDILQEETWVAIIAKKL